jgi:hypothetical protein
MIEHLCDMDDSQFGGDSEFITNDLRIGSNFAVHAEEDNDKGMEYYILFLLHPRFQVQWAFICARRNKFSVGDFPIEGMHYQKFGRNNSHNYVWLTWSQSAYIHAYFVMARDFLMMIQDHCVFGRDATYKLLEEHHELILSILDA